jgi:hypothetical protein
LTVDVDDHPPVFQDGVLPHWLNQALAGLVRWSMKASVQRWPEGAGQTHRESATPSNFRKLKPSSLAGKGAEVVENVGEATGRIAGGLTGDNPGKYLTDTLAGKK